MIFVPGRWSAIRKIRFARVALLALCALLGACRGETPAPPPFAGAVSPGPATDPASRLRFDAYGATWTPAPGDGAMLGPSSGSQTGLEVEGAIEPAGEPTPGFGLEVTIAGEARILLPGTWREARIEAEIETSDGPGRFDGSIAVELRGAEISRETIETPPGEPFVLALVLSETGTAETGATGLFDGKVLPETVPGPSLAEGRAGLRLRGEGTLRLRRLQVVSLASAPSDASE